MLFEKSEEDRLYCEGQQWETVYTWLKLAKKEEERQERGKRDALPYSQLSYVKSLIRNMQRGLALKCYSCGPWFSNA